ncbi:glycosyltransferase [Amylibacter sp.]|nr:glycosyltransferase [Amylibacter sp.]
MKITLYNPLGATQGHAQEYVDNICAGLISQDTEVILVTTDDYEIAQQEIRNSIIKYAYILGEAEVFGGAGNVLNSLRYGFWLIKTGFKSFSTLAKSIKDQKPDVCLMIGGSSLINAVVLPFFVMRFRKVKFGLTLHNVDLDWRLHHGNFVKKYYKILQIIFTKASGCMGVTLLCHGEYMMARAQEFLKSTSFDFNYYPVPSTISNLKIDVRSEKLSVPVILFFGVIRHDKGLDILVSALKEILDLDWHLVIAGSSEQVGAKYVLDCIDPLPSNRVTTDLRYFTNQERDDYFVRSSIVCLPYRKTFIAQSVVMIDAMRFKKPVITTDDSENGFNTRKYATGWSFESENVRALIDTLRRSLSKREDIKNEGFEKFNYDHTPKAVARKIMKIYGEDSGY